MARVFSGAVVSGFVAGLCGSALLPILIPRDKMRAVAKSALKTGLAIYERGQEAAAIIAENASDLVAEVNAERVNSVETQPEQQQGPPSKTAGKLRTPTKPHLTVARQATDA